MEILPKEVVAALRDAQNREAAKTSRLRVHAGGMEWPVLRRWRGGFALDATQVNHLRGLVDLYDGGKHVFTCLIMASDIEGGELICTTKRETRVTDRPALDFAPERPLPQGYLTRL